MRRWLTCVIVYASIGVVVSFLIAAAAAVIRPHVWVTAVVFWPSGAQMDLTYTLPSVEFGGIRRVGFSSDEKDSFPVWFGLFSNQEMRPRSQDISWVWAPLGPRSWGHRPGSPGEHPGVEDARGWPALCFWGHTESPLPQLHATGFGPGVGTPAPPSPVAIRQDGLLAAIRWARAHGVLLLDRDPSNALIGIPLRPIWSGLAINTALYGLLAYGVRSGMLRIHRLRRYGRGLCPRCAYDLQGDYSCGCSECGFGVERVRSRG